MFVIEFHLKYRVKVLMLQFRYKLVIVYEVFTRMSTVHRLVTIIKIRDVQ